MFLKHNSILKEILFTGIQCDINQINVNVVLVKLLEHLLFKKMKKIECYNSLLFRIKN